MVVTFNLDVFCFFPLLISFCRNSFQSLSPRGAPCVHPHLSEPWGVHPSPWSKSPPVQGDSVLCLGSPGSSVFPCHSSR